MDRNRKMLKMIEKNNSWRLILAMIRIAIYGITGIAVNVFKNFIQNNNIMKFL